jgi:colicin import membrane protein
VPAVGWKTACNLAILLHILIIASAIILPKYIGKQTIIPEVYTVDLVSVTEPNLQSAPPPAANPAKPPPPPKPVVKIQKLKSVPARKTAPIAPPVAEEAVVETAKPVSLKPLKRKKKNNNAVKQHARQQQEKKQEQLKKKRLAEAAAEKQRQRTLEAERQQHLQEARRQQALAAAEAKAAAAEAVNALKHSLQANAAASSAAANENRSSRQSGKQSSVLESQYYASIFAHLHQYWALPDIKTWDPDITATVVIVISKSGQILSQSFEKRSGDRVFDQFVSKTIADANPLPPIPGALKKQQYKLGLRFKPGGIH